MPYTATELVAGKKAHYFCDVCDTYFTEEMVATTAAELVIPAPTHTAAEDDGDCTTDILCTGCDKIMTEGADAHVDADTNGKCDTCGKDMPTTPGGDEPGTDTPGTDVPSTDVPSTDEPGTDTPGTDEPGTEPGTDDPNAGNTEDPTDDNDGLPTGAIIAIVAGSVVVGGAGIFALVWFVIKKKTWAEFLAIFKKG